ncbi:MAG TPA: phenylalanine--tRNA ligase subunit beta, partial [Bacteroidales bacterium]|nr:phenylalanine--tRNA ligase subunit beta [Bacteroidales bacterium]
MKISYKWLKQYHNLDLEPDKVAEYLTDCGLEVEGMEEFQSVRGGLKGVVIGEVLTCEKHPNSDHLSLTTVDTGTGTPLNIVCGAPNVAAGQKVAVATIGTTLCFGEKEITLQRTKIRGEISEGMICAEDELGLGNSHAGIMVLDPAAPVGLPAADWFGVEEDIVLTIGLTPNRVDAASHIGVARDLVAVANNSGMESADEGKKAILQLPDISGFSVDNNSRPIRVLIEDPEACARYSGITLSGITVRDSPNWLKNKLMAVGLRPINNIVDITNYILMELGHPLHAFDADRIDGKEVIVRKYPEGTKFTTLDNVERTLTSGDLMICSASEPMCMAGVFGGVRSGISAETTSIFLESAWFDPKHIRRTSRHHGLQTDASFRFERGADPGITIFALRRAAAMIREIAGGTISSDIVDVYPVPMPEVRVGLSFRNLDRLTGKRIDRGVVRSILHDLGFVISGETEGDNPGMSLVVPAAKVDVTREADVIEEVLRIYGYNNVEISDRLHASLSYTRKPDPDRIQNQIADFLAAHGFHEVMNNSLTRSAWYEGSADFPPGRLVKMLNPISRDLDVLRQTLFFGILESIVFNMNRKEPDLKLFEFGKVYSLAGKPSTGDPVGGYHEEMHFAMAVTGRRDPESWNSADQPSGFYDLKGFLGGVFEKLGIDTGLWQPVSFRSDIIGNGLEYSAHG